MSGTFSPLLRVSDPDTHHGTCVTHVPWCIPGSLTSGFLWSRGGENVPGIPGACATRNFTYLVRGLWLLRTASCRDSLDDYQDWSVIFPKVEIKKNLNSNWNLWQLQDIDIGPQTQTMVMRDHIPVSWVKRRIIPMDVYEPEHRKGYLTLSLHQKYRIIQIIRVSGDPYLVERPFGYGHHGRQV